MKDGEDHRLDASLRRIEALIAGLEEVRDPDAREAARELLDQVLDLHALALARMTAMVASAAEGGPALLARLAEDDQVRAVLLLHGLHPDTVETRVRAAVERLRPALDARGIGVKLLTIGPTAARLRVLTDGRIGDLGADALRQEIEDAVVGAAPELEEVVVEGLVIERLGEAGAASLPALAAG